MSQFTTVGNYRPASVSNIGNSVARTRGIKRTTVDHRDPPAMTRREYRQHRLARLADVAVTVGRWDAQDGWRMPVESLPDPAPVVQTPDGYEVPAFVRVAAEPHRTAKEARQIAERVADRPLTYLPLVLALLPGVTDLRVTFGKGAANG